MSTPPPNDWMTRTGATPSKLALIGVLGVVLVVVIVRQLPSRSSQPVALAPRVPSSLRNPSTPAATAASPSASNLAPWPRRPIDEVVAYDPFATPAWAEAARPKPKEFNLAADAAPNAEQQTLEKLRTMGATAVVEVAGEPIALVGEYRLRVGDRLAGFRVTRINQSGVVLAREDASP